MNTPVSTSNKTEGMPYSKQERCLNEMSRPYNPFEPMQLQERPAATK